ncbi:DUF2339 domain-containing protein [Aliihoeflea aestuarii]|uniref:DUF2339 domain-containing protein n=1 Tax=Aliihoeflea aestuarii TaxID=453840 RepID=UPI0020930B77|nr:DUF2339 domain-containing protein [Aliihoeflea aestuarii]MCO6389589.1 DUF2339 domain-containing protein [Aliihoeflea aestuarii]
MELLIIIALVVAFILLNKQNARLQVLERSIASLRTQIASSNAVTATQAESTVEEAVVSAMPEESAPALEEARAEEVSTGPWRATAVPVQAEEAEQPSVPTLVAEKPDIETALGTRWAVWVGGLALALGGIFLVRYSLEAGIFGPGVRLTFAALFGCALAAAGELARRKGFRAPVAGVSGAYIPAILTAASAFTLFGAVYAAHALYGFIGPAATFVVLGALAIATIVIALVHGQALAGLGLIGSYLTPMLVSSDAPNPWVLFVYLAIVLAATVSVASIRRWQILAATAYAGASLWSLAYLAAMLEPSAGPVAFLHLVGLTMIAAIWLRNVSDSERDGLDLPTIVAGVMTGLVTALLVRELVGLVSARLLATTLLVAMVAVAMWRPRAIALLHAAGATAIMIQAWDYFDGSFYLLADGGTLALDGAWPLTVGLVFAPYSGMIAALVLIAGVFMARQIVAESAARAAAWAFWAAALPLVTVAATWVLMGNLNIDWRFAFLSFVLAGVLAVCAELVGRAEERPQTGGLAVSFLAAGAAAAFCLALLAGFGPVMTTILTGFAAALPAVATRLRSWPVLGWISAGFAAVTLARIGIDPTIAGPERLSTTPVLNALTPGYLLPATAFAYAAWQLAQTGDGRARLAMEAFAALFALLGVAMLVRHAMNGGVIDASEPALAEQAIYTLIMIGGGAILLVLDRRSPSPVFQWGSIALGVLSMLFIASSHLIALNPLYTNASTGSIPIFNLLLLAYLIPAAAMAALAWRARGIRPDWYVAMLAIGASALAFAYVSLSVRRIFQGEFIGAWKGMGELETYTHSAVWLLLGVALLVAGLRFGSRTLRLASAALVVLAVAKVFLYDMRQLEGVLRALSFMGLGGVLIGIGLFYQRMLGKSTKSAPA